MSSAKQQHTVYTVYRGTRCTADEGIRKNIISHSRRLRVSKRFQSVSLLVGLAIVPSLSDDSACGMSSNTYPIIVKRSGVSSTTVAHQPQLQALPGGCSLDFCAPLKFLMIMRTTQTYPARRSVRSIFSKSNSGLT